MIGPNLSTLAFFFLLGAQPDQESPPSEPLEILIQRLGDSSWQVREEAQRALIARGAEALDLLIQATRSEDPEVALRSKLILNQVNPLRVRIRIQRIELGKKPWILETLEGEANDRWDIQIPLRQDHGERLFGYTVHLRVIGDQQVDLSIEEGVPNTAMKILLHPPSPEEGAVGILKRGEEGIYRQIGLHMERERIPFAIVARWWKERGSGAGGKGDPAAPAADLPTLLRDLLIQAEPPSKLQDRLAALELLGLLRFREAEKVFRSACEDPRLEGTALIGLSALGDREALEVLAEFVKDQASIPSAARAPAKEGKSSGIGSEFLEDGRQVASALEGEIPEVVWQNRALLTLMEAGFEGSIERMARRISEFDPTTIHFTLAAIADAWSRNPRGIPDPLLDAVSSPEFLARLAWEDPEAEYFFGTLLENQEIAKNEAFIQKLFLSLAKALGNESWSSTGRPRTFARLWERVARGEGTSALAKSVLKEILARPGSPTRLSETLAWVSLCFRTEPMPDGEFLEFMARLREAFRRSDDSAPASYMNSSALIELSRNLALTRPQLVELAGLLAEVAQNPKHPYSLQFLREIDRLTGLSLSSRPRQVQVGASQAGEELGGVKAEVKRWAEDGAKTAASHERLFPAAGGAGGENLDYWEFEVLSLEGPDVKSGAESPSPGSRGSRRQILDGRRLGIQAGVPLRSFDRWGNRLVYRIESIPNLIPKRYRLNGQADLEPGQPTIIVLRDREIRIGKYETSDIRLGPYYLSMPKGQRLSRIAWIREPKDRTGPAPGAPVDPDQLWGSFLKEFIGTFSLKSGDRAFQVIREFDIVEAIPAIVEGLFSDEARRSSRYDFLRNVARWLLEKGEPAGGEFLHAELKETDFRRRLLAAGSLAACGDPIGFEATMKSIRERPKDINLYEAYLNLESYLKSRGPRGEEYAEVMEFVIQNLGDPYFQPSGFNFLSRQADTDFGYSQSRSLPAEERRKAILRSVEDARNWWEPLRKLKPSPR